MLSQRSLGAAGTGLVLPSDDEFNRVSFLSHFDGTNNGVNNVFDDSSTSNHTITANGNVTQGSFGPFARPDGEWAVSFDGSGDRVRANWAENVGTSDFTIEAWVFIPSDMDQYDCIAWLQEANHSSAGDNGFFIRANNSNTIEFAVLSGGTVFNAVSSAVSFNEWHHLSISKSGTTMYYSVDGTVANRSAPSGINNSKYLNIGAADANGSVSYPFKGLISNVRFIIGTALYTSSFTPSTSPLTAITNTKFLGCQSNRFVDNSANNYTVSTSGNAAVSAFGPFLTSEVYDAGVNGASWYCDAQGDYLSMSTGGTALQNPSTFTLEGWIYMKQAPASGVATAIFAQGNAGQTALYNSYSVGVRSDLAPRVVTAGFQQETIQSSTAINLNEWAHLALTWDGTTWSLYQNGVREGTSTSQPISTTNYNQAYFGRDYYDDSRFAPKCFYSDIRMVTSLLYTGSTYTVPTAPLTAVANTQLLVHCKEAQAIDSAAQNNLTLFSTAKTSTTQSKFGGASLLLDGNSDYANFPETEANNIDGAGDWTVEFFWRFNNNTSPVYQMLLTKGYGLQIYTINGGLALALSYDNSNYFISTTGGTTLSNDTWYHVAVVKNGTSYKVYLDGTSETNLGGTSSSTLGTGGGRWHLGALETAELTYPANGYMDSVRISKLARYTSNFTAPTAAFADKGQ